MTNDPTSAHWFKSSHSGSAGDCVEAAWLDERTIAVRDSKDPTRPALVFTRTEWAAFTRRITES